MSTTLGTQFATAVPEMAVAWEAAEVGDPTLLALNEPLAGELGLDPAWLRTGDGLRFLTGNAAEGVAQAYAGHQFGGYSPRLGDGRALLLGEIEVDGQLRDLHLKGSGRTPFARGGDGLAAVGPMLREFVVSEAMHALGVPTTRSLAVVGTGATVHRETPLPGAVLARVAASHLRVGSFQYARNTGDLDLLRRLADHAIARHYPGRSYLEFFREVVGRQARLIAQWMHLGFIHGVMNTDNMTISGETIDYGPCAFMEAYDPATVYSSIDHRGRYAYGNQPGIGQWNLARLAEALLPLFDEDEDAAVKKAVGVLEEFEGRYLTAWQEGMRAKLGGAGDDQLIGDLLKLLHENHVDHTSFFHHLTRGNPRDLVLDLAGVDAWLARWRAEGPDTAAMTAVNPVYVPRNHLVEEALAAATGGDLGPFERLLDAVRRPYDEREGLERYAEPAPRDFSESYQTFCGT
ncbi:protein adenylyltransferase SelO [Lentzea sp. NPDC042327]|uniref:protein adenylyltransferase SelO n=1 Tax=Lentzea sp. NPDC042327 TaxID=3154801 RepID=UPI00340D6B5B